MGVLCYIQQSIMHTKRMKKFNKPLPYLVQANSYPIKQQVKELRKMLKPVMQRRLPTVYYSGFKHGFIINYIKRMKQTHGYYLKIDIQKFYPSLSHNVFLTEVQLAYKQLLGLRSVPSKFKKKVLPVFHTYFAELPGHTGIPLGNNVSSTFATLSFCAYVTRLKKTRGTIYCFRR